MSESPYVRDLKAVVDAIRDKGLSDEADRVQELMSVCEHIEKKINAEILTIVEKEKDAQIKKLIREIEYTKNLMDFRYTRSMYSLENMKDRLESLNRDRKKAEDNVKNLEKMTQPNRTRALKEVLINLKMKSNQWINARTIRGENGKQEKNSL